MRTLLFVFVAVLLAIPATASAQGIPTGTFEFKVANSDSKNKETIKAGIEKAIEDMSFITRPIARGKLEDSNIAFKKLSIKFTPKKVTVQQDNRNPVVAPPDGSPITWKRGDGEKFKVTQIVKPQLIIQTFFSEDGKKTIKYKFDKDYKKVTMSVTVKSPKLSGPLNYTIPYVAK